MPTEAAGMEGMIWARKSGSHHGGGNSRVGADSGVGTVVGLRSVFFNSTGQVR